MLKTLTLRMAASTLLVFSIGVALAAGPGNAAGSLAGDAAGGGEETLRQVAAPTEGRIRLPRPRKVPSRAPSETGRAQASADPGEKPTRPRVAGDAHDRYANAETGHLLNWQLSGTRDLDISDCRLGSICDATLSTATGRHII